MVHHEVPDLIASQPADDLIMELGVFHGGRRAGWKRFLVFNLHPHTFRKKRTNKKKKTWPSKLANDVRSAPVLLWALPTPHAFLAVGLAHDSSRRISKDDLCKVNTLFLAER